MMVLPLILAIVLQLSSTDRREAEAALNRVPQGSAFSCHVYVPQVNVAPGMSYTFVVGYRGPFDDWSVYAEI